MPNTEQFRHPAPQTEIARTAISPDSGSIILKKTEEEKRIQLSLRQERILSLFALGLSNLQIAGTILWSEQTVKHEITNIIDAFRAYSMLDATVKATKTGNVDLEEVTKDLNKNGISILSEKEKETLETTTRDGGAKSNKEIASDMSIAEQTVKNNFGSILRKLGINRTRAVLLYLAYKKANAPSS